MVTKLTATRSTLPFVGRRKGMGKSSLIATIAAMIVVGIEMIWTVSQDWGLLAMSTFSFFPMIVSLVCAFSMPKPTCQGTLFVGSLLYMAWMVFFVVYCFVINPGPLGPIAFLAGPIYSLPVMTIVWVVAAKQNASGPTITSTPPQNS